MLRTASKKIELGTAFKDAYDSIPELEVGTRQLYTHDGLALPYYQVKGAHENDWSSPRKAHVTQEGAIILPDTNTKKKLGLPKKPAAENMDIDINGKITGLF